MDKNQEEDVMEVRPAKTKPLDESEMIQEEDEECKCERNR